MSSPEVDPPKKLEPIPMPAHRIWEEFRTCVLPPLAFAGTLAAIVFLWRQNVIPRPASEAQPRTPPVPSLTNAWPRE